MPQFPSNSERCLLMKYELKEVVVETRYRNLLRGRILQFVLGLLSPENVVKSLSVKDIKCVSDPVLLSIGIFIVDPEPNHIAIVVYDSVKGLLLPLGFSAVRG